MTGCKEALFTLCRYTFTAYFSNVGDELLRKKAEKNYWKNLTANFIAQKPART